MRHARALVDTPVGMLAQRGLQGGSQTLRGR